MIVIVSGPPGAGKTTVARQLATARDHSVHLESDDLFRWIVGGFVAPHLPAAAAQNATVIDLTCDLARRWVDAGYDVVWDGVVGPWWLEQIAARLSDHPGECHWLALRPTREIGLQRVRDRDDTDDVSGAAVMADQFGDLGRHERYVIDADGAPDTIVEACERAITEGTHLLPRLAGGGGGGGSG